MKGSLDSRIVKTVPREFRDHVVAWLDGEPVAAELELGSSEARAVYELLRRDPETLLETLEFYREEAGLCPFELAELLAEVHDRLWRLWGGR